MPRSWLDKLAGTVPDHVQNGGSRPSGGYGYSKPTQREVRSGDRFSDGAARGLKDPTSGKFYKVGQSPKELKAQYDAIKAKGKPVVVEKMAPIVESTDGGSGCSTAIVGFLIGGAAVIEGIIKIIG